MNPGDEITSAGGRRALCLLSDGRDAPLALFRVAGGAVPLTPLPCAEHGPSRAQTRAPGDASPAAFAGACAAIWERLRPLRCRSSGLTWCHSTSKCLRLSIRGVAGDQQDRTAHLRVGKRLSWKEITLVQKIPGGGGEGGWGKSFSTPRNL